MKNTKIIAISNQKGGVGKTTFASNFGYYLALKKQKVLMIDLDPSGNLSIAVQKERSGGPSCADFLQEPSKDKIVLIDEWMHLLISSPKLAQLNLMNDLDTPELLKNALEPYMDLYDYVLIDCPPEINQLTHNAYTAADHIVIPITPGKFAIEGLALLKKEFDSIKRMYNPALSILGVFMNDVDKNTRAEKSLSLLAEQCVTYLQTSLFSNVIYHSTIVNSACERHLPVYLFNPKAKVSISYLNLLKEVEAKANERC